MKAIRTTCLAMSAAAVGLFSAVLYQPQRDSGQEAQQAKPLLRVADDNTPDGTETQDPEQQEQESENEQECGNADGCG